MKNEQINGLGLAFMSNTFPFFMLGNINLPYYVIERMENSHHKMISLVEHLHLNN